MKLRSLSLHALLALLPTFALAQNAELKNTVITSDGPFDMVRNEKEATITFRDKVVVTGTNMKLTCDYLEVIVVSGGDITATLGKPEKFRSLVATGHVVLVQGDREAACGRAEVLPGEDKVILTENPVVVDHDGEQSTRAAGEKITLWRAQRRVQVEKPIFTGPAFKDLGVDKELKPATAPAAPAPATPAATPAPAPKQP